MDVTPGFSTLLPPKGPHRWLVPGVPAKDVAAAFVPRPVPSPHGPGNSSSRGNLQDTQSTRNVRDYLVLIINYGLSCFRAWNRSQNLHQGGQDISGNSNS